MKGLDSGLTYLFKRYKVNKPESEENKTLYCSVKPHHNLFINLTVCRESLDITIKRFNNAAVTKIGWVGIGFLMWLKTYKMVSSA